MIVRLLTARIRQDHSAPFHVLMREQLPILHAHEGLVYTKLARRLDGPFELVLLFEEWRDPAAMYTWTGPDPSSPRLVPGAEELIEELSITHYEALDIHPEP